MRDGQRKVILKGLGERRNTIAHEDIEQVEKQIFLKEKIEVFIEKILIEKG